MNIPSKTDINGSDFNLEGEFEEIFNKSPVGIIIYDKKGKIMNLNKSALDIMGIPSLENVKGFSLFDNPYIADQKEKLQKEGSIKFQSPLDLDLLRALSFYNPTRSGVIFLDYMVSVTDSGYLVQIQDITKLKTADEINASEEKFCAIFDSMHESFMLGEIILDNERKPYDWVYISVNRAAASSYGMKPDEIENKRFRELFPDMEPPYLKEIGKAVLTGEIVKNMEMFSPITGNYIEVDIYPQNKGIFAVFTRIITERKRVENELKARNERYKHLVQHAPTGIYEMDYRGPKFKSVNDVMCQILGYTKEELLSMNPFDLLSDESKDLFKERIKKGLNGQKIDNSVDFKIKTKDGNEIWAALDIQLIYKDGNIDGALVVAHDITERKQIEEELRASEEVNRSIIASSPDCIKVLDLEGNLLMMSEAGQNLLEINDITSFLNQSFINFWQEKDKLEVRVAISSASKGNAGHFTAYCPSMRGTPKWWDVIITPILGANGKPEKLLAVSRDITEIKFAERQINGKNALLDGINKVFQESLTSETEEDVATKCLEVAEGLTGSEFGFLSEIDVKGHLTDIALSPNVLSETPNGKAHERLTDKNIVNYWLKLIKEEKSQIINETSSVPEISDVPGGHPPIKSFMGVPLKQGNDIIGLIGLANKKGGYTEEDKENIKALSVAFVEALMRKRAEIGLKEMLDNLELKVQERTKEIRYQANLLENVNDAIISTDKKYNIISWNKAAQGIYGWRPEEVIGKNSIDILQVEYINANREEVIELIAKNGNYKGESIHKCRDGTSIPIESTLVQMKDKKDNIIGYVSVNRDISRRKKSEKILEETINELKHSNEELKRFAYVASHDLQEPLRTIASFTQLLERRYKGQLDSDADEFMDYIVEAAIRMKKQIEGLLEYSRIATTGEEFKPVNMNDVLYDTIQNLNTLIKESNADITYEKLPIVVCDAGQLQRVIQNLISNAIRFRKHEEPLKINISAFKDEKSREYVFSIADNGIGIEQQYIELIFVIFQRLHTRDVYEGTGIGLSIVKRIIEHHGGRIWVESSFGKGSTFYFSIPYFERTSNENV